MYKRKDINLRDIKVYLFLIITIIIFFMLIHYCLKISDKLYKTYSNVNPNTYVENVNIGDIIEQKIIAQDNNFKRIDIEFEPFKEKLNIAGKVKIGIKDNNLDVIEEKIITRNYIRENNTYEFEFKIQKKSKGKEYTLYLQFEEIETNKDFFSVKIDKDYIDSVYLINNKSYNGKLAIKEFYLSTTKQLFFLIITMSLGIYAIFVCIYIYNKNNIKTEKIFLLTVPVICLFYIFAMPTFKNHDELYHWYRAYEVSIGKFASEINGDVLGTEMPDNISKPSTNDWTKLTYHNIKEYLNLGIERYNTRVLYSETSAVYCFIQYLPQGIGIFITRLFTDKVLLLAYAGRIFNMIVALTCIYIAIKMIPFGKKIILLISYIPIAIEGFTSLSPDAMTISLSILYISYILYLSFDKNIDIVKLKEKIILLILSVTIALCKIVYVPLVLLMFLIPKEKFKKGNKLKEIIIIAGIASIANLIWLKFSSIYLSNFREGDSSIQIRLLFMHPIQYIQNCVYTLNLNGKNYIYTMFGGELGWGELIKINSIVPYTLFILTIWTTIIDETIKDIFKLYQKNIIFLTITSIVGLIFTSLYVQWTNIGADSILGIQGRYFIPILPLIMFFVGSQIKIKSEYNEKKITKSIGIIGTLLQIIVISQIVICHL